MANYNVSITGNHTFVPQTQQVKSGDTVTWVDNDPDTNTSHTVTPDDPADFQGSGDINTGDTFGPISVSGAPRTIHYYCQYHGGPGGAGMSGQIVVVA
jgi:plastocyanin